MTTWRSIAAIEWRQEMKHGDRNPMRVLVNLIKRRLSR